MQAARRLSTTFLSHPIRRTHIIRSYGAINQHYNQYKEGETIKNIDPTQLKADKSKVKKVDTSSEWPADAPPYTEDADVMKKDADKKQRAADKTGDKSLRNQARKEHEYAERMPSH
eukprot:TRINITY_DN1703_c0_g1_i1.p1 TRINITY_DN1703_c0_g1~~TRINITY_DN1703_c0_g1_i1.p1  ORF type:complete len:116 (+),score=45.33 TRINITY_DN1703_c0_g1_i1:47-394(+)